MESFLRKTGRFVFGKVLPHRAYPVVSGPLRGAKFILGSMAGEGGGGSIYFNLVESEQTAMMLKEITADKVFFDIGANIGYYSILASKRVGEKGAVVAFEPVISNLTFLQRHVELNSAKNVRVLPFALSDKQSIASFSLGQNSAMGHLSENGDSAENLVYVPTITLDEITEKMNLMPDVMKIDVEGAEMEVFAGATKVLSEAKPTIFLSTHSPELRRDCLDFLRKCGYEVKSMFAEGVDSHEFVAKFLQK
jgi:FkbM family methyltransferase